MQSTRPGEFIALVALLTALVAMSIDTMLPALGIMANELGASHPNDRHFIILGFFAGLMFGTLPFGPLSDAWGRKPTIFFGLVIYAIGAFVCMFATSFPILIAGRILQGIGAASPRTASMAMVRDGAAGAEMARIMSFVMSVFMLIPILAPSVGQLVLYVASWRVIFGGFVAVAVIAAIWLALRQGETLPVEKRQPLELALLKKSAAEVLRNPVSLGYTMAVGGVFATFSTWLSVCQQVIAEQYQQGDKFALWFGGFGLVIAASMISNGKLVKKLGMRRLSQLGLRVYITVMATLLALSLAYGGQPPLALFGALIAVWFYSAGFIFGNYNAMAMEPMGHIAGMAASISGALSSLVALILAGIAGRFYNGTLTPIAFAFLLFALIALFWSEWAERNRPAPDLVAA
jgi:MFS transporter, DHA1 family, multidrug resistance protein